MDLWNKIIGAFEVHSVEEIRECFQDGYSPNQVVNGTPLIYHLVSMYTRGPLFKACVKAFVDYGLEFEDKVLLSVLLDDSAQLDKQLASGEDVLLKQYSLDSAFTPLYKVSLLHICAEFNHLDSAKILVKHGADVNTRAGVDDHGFGGQTPIFHTVNQHTNKCIDVMKFLVSQGADLGLTVTGLIWGKGMEWETFIPAANPISYAMMGLLRQFQRTEKQIYEVVQVLMKAHYGIEYHPTNIPNKYLVS